MAHTVPQHCQAPLGSTHPFHHPAFTLGWTIRTPSLGLAGTHDWVVDLTLCSVSRQGPNDPLKGFCKFSAPHDRLLL